MRIPRAHELASWLLSDSMKRFDRAVSRQSWRSGSTPSSRLTSPRADLSAPREATLRILDFIDSDLRYQNRYYESSAGSATFTASSASPKASANRE
jgi:hypothetical protein